MICEAEHPADPRFTDLTGRKYGILTVISYAGVEKRRRHKWNCLCECGSTAKITRDQLTCGKTRSCGCRSRKWRHGLAKSKEYAIWEGIIQRCTNPNSNSYKNYGARGVTVCDEWRHSFQAFISDMGNRPTDKHQIDRIDNDSGYSKSNCMWSTKKQNNRNKRTTRYVTYRGESKPLIEWSEVFGIRYSVLRGRLNLGWDFDRAITEPIRIR